MFKWILVAVAGAALVISTVAIAQSRLGDDEHHHGPGPASIAACKDKNEGDACEFDGHHGHVAGACHKARSGVLACMGPHHHEHDADGGAP